MRVPPRIELSGRSLLIDLGEPHRVASTSVNGGLRTGRYIVVHTVGGDFKTCDYREYVERVIEDLGLGEEPIVMLTAVDVASHRAAEGEHVWALVTVGLSHPTCIGMEEAFQAPQVSTINLVVVSLNPLTDAGLLDMLRVVAEAKASAVSDLLPWCPTRPTGTVSDAITVASPIGPKAMPWSGMATLHGGEAARLVHKIIVEADDRSLESRLKGALGLGLDELVEDAVKLYSTAPVPGVSTGRVREIVKEEISRMLKDPNVWAILVAAREADLHARTSTIPLLPGESYLKDTPGLVADEVLAASLALYIQGWKGLMAAYWVDREKHKLGLALASLPGLLDDIASALVGAALSRVYDSLLGDRG